MEEVIVDAPVPQPKEEMKYVLQSAEGIPIQNVVLKAAEDNQGLPIPIPTDKPGSHSNTGKSDVS